MFPVVLRHNCFLSSLKHEFQAKLQLPDIEAGTGRGGLAESARTAYRHAVAH